MSRRGLIKSAGSFAAAGILVTPGLAFANSGTIDVTVSPFNASPNKQDNSAAFQSALNQIAANGGGRLYVPGGNYLLGSPLTYSGNSLTVFGDGQDSSVLINTHGGTVITANLADASKCLTVQTMGFSPCLSGMAQAAISVVVPAQPSGWQNALIQDVCIGVPFATNAGQYTSYNKAIRLTNTTRARINNVNVHANSITGGIAIALEGTCYDTRVLGCTLEGYAFGVATLGYCEGLHLANDVIICGTAVHTGTTNYNSGTMPINLLELLMSDCEINTSSECLYLYQVKNAQITNCHFTGPKNAQAGAAIDFRGSTNSLVANCTFCNSWTPGGQYLVGIAFNPSSRLGTTSCHVSDVQFENTMVAIYFGAGAQSNTATNVQLLALGCGALVNGSAGYGSQSQQIFADVSGNISNNATWLTTANTNAAATTRRVSSQH